MRALGVRQKVKEALAQSTGVLIRYFRPSDVWAVYELASDNLKEQYNPTVFTELSIYWPSGFLVVEEMGRIIGFLFGIMSSEEECRVLMLAVKKEYRNRGIGTMLLNRFLREGANRGVHSISLEVRASNLTGIRFYQRLGFMLTGRIPGYYTNGEDGYTLRLHL
jgi:ribosomal-protein-alanine N-acetyltransferase